MNAVFTEIDRMKPYGMAVSRSITIATIMLLAACSATPMRPDASHLIGTPQATLNATDPEASDIPQPVLAPSLPPPPRTGPALETYSVVVSQVEIAELLFAMARDAKINVDVSPQVQGKVTLNAIEQTLPQILNRLSRQVPLRYEFDGSNLVVLPDHPFVRQYTIDYVNVSREASASTNIATQISSTGSGAGASGDAGQSNNNSTTQIVNRSNNQFWDTLVANLRALIGASNGADEAAAGAGSRTGNPSATNRSGSGGSTPAPEQGLGGSGVAAAQAAAGSAGPALQAARPSVIASPETGVVLVRATAVDHERVQAYLDQVMHSAQRQVLIEATIAEVQLSEEYQQGVNWAKLRLDGTGWSFVQQPDGTAPLSTGVPPLGGPAGIGFPTSLSGTGNLPGGAAAGNAANASLGVLRYLRNGSTGSIGFALSLLQSFGKVKVLSSPKISVLNNQTAVLKVVDNRIYFTIDVQITPGTDTTAPLVTYTSTPNTVPVGFVMSVTPQIEAAGGVTMNVRPTISRIVGFVNDPNPALAQNNVVSRVPEIQTREIESILKVRSGDVAVMGGLMQESVDDQQDVVPGPAHIPFVGELFRYRSEKSRKSELVIFLRPMVIKDASMDGDYRGLKPLQPGEDFFTKPDRLPVPRAWRASDAQAADTGSVPAR